MALYQDPAATLGDLRKAVTTLVETVRVSQRVLGNLHPLTVEIGSHLTCLRATLRARETPSPGGSA